MMSAYRIVVVTDHVSFHKFGSVILELPDSGYVTVFQNMDACVAYLASHARTPATLSAVSAALRSIGVDVASIERDPVPSQFVTIRARI